MHFIYFEWTDKSLMMGQYWHPLILPECFADTIAFNGGSPFEPFSREPQVRLTKQFGTMTFILQLAHMSILLMMAQLVLTVSMPVMAYCQTSIFNFFHRYENIYGA